MLRPLKINHSGILILFGASLVSNCAFAKEITPQTALDRYLTLTETGTRSKSQDYRLSFTAVAESAQIPAYYAFSKGDNDGFVILSADDRLKPVLGYTDSGSFEMDKLPENIKWFLEGYRKEISYALKAGIIELMSSGTRSQGADPIAPMISTKWDQGEVTVTGNAYNSLCPRIGSKKCYSGCVATSMSQIINYHNWPESHGSGKWQYEWSYYQNGTNMSRELEFDFENTVFDWANMLEDYNKGGGNDVQNNAVATLMYACGVSVEASYGTSATGAFSSIIADAMRTFFNYDGMTRYIKRDFFSTEEWEAIIYNELKEGRPLIYGGSTIDEGGHSFICDGYDGNGLFHINWGWGGLSDGFFSLSALNPYEQGTGSHEGGYDYYQDAVIGIQPPQAGNQEIALLYVLEGSFAMSSLPDIDGQMSFKFPGWLTNGSLFPHTYSLGIKVVDSDGNDVGIMESVSGDLSLDGYVRGDMYMEWGKNQLKRNYTFKTSAELYYTLPQGTYTLVPVYRTENMDWNQLYTDTAPHTVTIVIGESDVKNIESTRFAVSVEGSEIVVSGAVENELINVYSASGQCMASCRYTGDVQRLSPGGRGIYIVKCGQNIRKVVIK